MKASSHSCVGLLIATVLLPAAPAQTPLSLTTRAAEPARFVAVHGRGSLVMGYAAPGLEVWAYPFQIVRHYHIGFLPQGALAPIPGNTLLRRVEYRPGEVIRTYVGNDIGGDFVVHEHLFVPLDRPGAILTYDTEGRRPVDIDVTFDPTLNLMWPASVGGQGIRWSDPLHGYIVTESTDHYSAVIASPQATGHSPVGNPTLRQSLTQTMRLHPVPGKDNTDRAKLIFALDPPDESSFASDPALVQISKDLARNAANLETKATLHYQTLLDDAALRIETPDPQVNQAIAWSEIALDQAWVCNPQLGCGIVAGYGPSRGTRRPQYDWFFAGDGLVAMRALLAAGEYNRARAELAFILKYQDKKNGMIWHELSQSAGLIDWRGKYPYMFVHVDITFDFLAGVAEYYKATGDRAFVKKNWAALTRAYQYCLSVIDPDTSLPRIPAGKEGANEQRPMRDSTALSSAWVSAAESYAALARAVGHADEATDAAKQNDRAKRALAANVWDSKIDFWTAGHTAAGKPVTNRRGGPAALLTVGVLSPQHLDAALDQLASSNYQTDWGMRSLPSNVAAYNPNSYAAGSVSALATSVMAGAFWQDHRPEAAWQMWRALVPWSRLDSLGHMDEVLVGDSFHSQEESVPEQTWSSAGFLSATVEGLLGIHIDAPHRHLTLAPHLPPAWGSVTLDHLQAAGAQLSATIEQQPGAVELTLQNTGRRVDLTFAPEIALGATALHAEINGKPAPGRLLSTGSEPRAQVSLEVPAGETRLHLSYSGGVALLLSYTAPALGDASENLRLVCAILSERTLTLRADVKDAAHASLDIRTAWNVSSIKGATVTQPANGVRRVIFPIAHRGTYTPAEARIVFSQP